MKAIYINIKKQKTMKDFATIESFFSVEEPERVVSGDLERGIIEHMQEYVSKAQNRELEAYTHASTILLNC